MILLLQASRRLEPWGTNGVERYVLCSGLGRGWTLVQHERLATAEFHVRDETNIKERII
jgi:hypothetical protein